MTNTPVDLTDEQRANLASALTIDNSFVAILERDADRLATIVADRCQGSRKVGQAPERYAIIWQAARLGVREAAKLARAHVTAPPPDIADALAALNAETNEMVALTNQRHG